MKADVMFRQWGLMCIFLCGLFLFPLTSGAQQPPGTIDVKAEAGAVGDGYADDTQAINDAVSMAYAQGMGVYFPPGFYRVSGDVRAQNGVSLYGDYAGTSVITSDTAPLLGDATTGITLNNIVIEDLFFHNVAVKFANNVKENYSIRRCVFFTAGNTGSSPAGEDYQLVWNHIRNGVIEDCLFLRQADSWGRGISTYKSVDCKVNRNVFGLDLNNTAWLASQWPGYGAWSNLIGKLSTMRSHFNLDSDQGRFKTGMNPNLDNGLKIYDNIFNGSPYDDEDALQDHVIYSKLATNMEIVGNWFRGWPVTPSGGVKLRNTYGPIIVAANHFVNTPLLAYAYDYTVPYAYQNVLYYRNWFDITEGLSFNRLGLSYWENTKLGADINIEYDHNIYNTTPGIGDIHLGGGSDLSEHKVYPTNFYAGTSTLIPIYPAGTAYASGSPDPAKTAPFSAYPVWFPNIPEYGTVNQDGQPPTAPTGLTYSSVTDSTVSLSWNPSSDNVGVTGYDIFGDGIKVGASADASFTVTGLSPNTAYRFTVVAKDAAGNMSGASNAVDVTTTGTSPLVYCPSSGGSAAYEWIASVQIGGFYNASGAAGYTDFTSQTVNLSAGANNLTLVPGFSGTAYAEYWGIWVDFDNNGSFNEPGELVFSGSGTGSVGGTLTVPAGVSGATRMRVSMKYYGAPASCEAFGYGEVEDYTVNISAYGP